MALDGAEAYGEYSIDFSWTHRQAPRRDVLTFDLLFRVFAYSADGGTPMLPFNKSHGFDPGLDSAGIRVRCDHGVAKAGSNGCVFPQAAAVFVVGGGRGKPAEAVAHMREALDEGAPGRIVMRQGFRAVADAAATGTALQRTQIAAMRDANRYASCGGAAASVIRQRPKHSASCGNGRQGGCDCDEYPFASTYQGAFENRLTTSAKFVLSEDNQAVGRALGRFYVQQRVVDLSYGTGVAGVATDPYRSFVRDDRGDLFWVHIPPD